MAALQQLSPHDFLTLLDVLCEQFLRAATRSRHLVAACTNLLAAVPPTLLPPGSSSEGVSLPSPAPPGSSQVGVSLSSPAASAPSVPPGSVWVGVSLTAAERATVSATLQSVGTSLWGRMQSHVSALLEARSELHAQLPLAELQQVWEHCTDFVRVAGRLFGSRGKALLGTLLRQARASLEVLHHDQLVHMQSLLHEELWKPALVPSVLQAEVMSLAENPRVRLRRGGDA